MRPEILPLGVGEMSRGAAPHFLTLALRAWRGITSRQWAWTTAIALVLLLAHVIGLLPPLLNVAPNLVVPKPDGWSVAKSVGATVVHLAAAYCFLLAISIAEHGAGHRVVKVRRYVVAGLAACGAAVLIEISLYVLVPGFSPKSATWPPMRDTQWLLGRVVWSAANFGLTGGLALAVYMRFRSARLTREAFNAAELERVDASRKVLASRLAAMQAQVEPRFLLGTLAQVEALYERDSQTGDRMLDALIAYLHAALPRLRSQRSTLGQEVELAESYLRIMQIRMGSRLSFRVDVRRGLDDCDFPPMVMLPLVDDALRNGLEPLPHGGAIAITADTAGDRVRVRIADDGMPRKPEPNDGTGMPTLRDRLSGLYGNAAGLEVIANVPHGVIASIEVPLDTARDYR